jgi:hypothetical protein
MKSRLYCEFGMSRSATCMTRKNVSVETFDIPSLRNLVVKELFSPIVDNGSLAVAQLLTNGYPPIATGGENTVGPLTSDSRALSAV